MNDFGIRAHRSPWYQGCELLLTAGGQTKIVCSLTVEKAFLGEYLEPTFKLTDTAAQVLLDDLWAAGYRPAAVLTSDRAEGALKATQEHLADMRRLVFNADIEGRNDQVDRREDQQEILRLRQEVVRLNRELKKGVDDEQVD